MKAQELINKAIAFYADPDNSIGFRGTGCVYYLNDKAKCGVGCLMSDAEYVQHVIDDHLTFVPSIIDRFYKFAFDNARSDDPKWQKVRDILTEILPTDLPVDEQLVFLNCLQRAHDSNISYARSEKSMSFLEAFKIALKQNLELNLGHRNLKVE